MLVRPKIFTDFLPYRKVCRCSCHEGIAKHITACCIPDVVRVLATVTRRIHQTWPSDLPVWGFDCPHGFAPFGEQMGARDAAQRSADRYNVGETTWSYWPLDQTILIGF